MRSLIFECLSNVAQKYNQTSALYVFWLQSVLLLNRVLSYSCICSRKLRSKNCHVHSFLSWYSSSPHKGILSICRFSLHKKKIISVVFYRQIKNKLYPSFHLNAANFDNQCLTAGLSVGVACRLEEHP